MNTVGIPERWRKFEIPGRIALETGNGGLPKIAVTTGWSTAEIYLHGAQVTGFKKDGEAPLLFLSARSWFAPGKSIRGGVPICYPWFGPRAGETAHGLVRFLAWELAAAAAARRQRGHHSSATARNFHETGVVRPANGVRRHGRGQVDDGIAGDPRRRRRPFGGGELSAHLLPGGRHRRGVAGRPARRAVRRFRRRRERRAQIRSRARAAHYA